MSDEKWKARVRDIIAAAARKPSHADIENDLLQLGREMADARAEEIAHLLSIAPDLRNPVWSLPAAVSVARSTIYKPKTREQVLQDAAEAAHNALTMGDENASVACEILARALEYGKGH